MDFPSKRLKLSEEPDNVARRLRVQRRFLHRRQSVVTVDATVEISVTQSVSVDVDNNGVPTSTTTLSPSSSAAPSAVPSAAAAATSLPTSTASPAAPSAASSSVPASIAAATPSGSSLLPATASSRSLPLVSSSTPPSSSSLSVLPAVATNSPSISSFVAPSSSFASVSRLPLLSASNSSSSFPSSGISSTASLGFTLSGFNVSSTASGPSSKSILSSKLPSSSSRSSSTISSSVFPTEESSSSSVDFPGETGFAGLPGGISASPSSVPTGHGRNGTAKGPINDGTSPPVVAGAVVGSVGGMAVLLLLLVLVARWWKHHSRSVRYESRGDSATDLTPHQSNINSVHTSRFFPAAAAGFVNRMSGGHGSHRTSSPTLPNVQERGFQKIQGRKLPSQFPTGAEEGPVTKDFEKPGDIEKSGELGAVEAISRMRGVSQQSPSSSYYRDSDDTTGFFARHAAGNHPESTRESNPVVAPPPLFNASSSEEATPTPGPSGSVYNPMDKEIIRPGPARTPVINPGGSTYFRDFGTPSPPYLTPQGHQQHDTFDRHNGQGKQRSDHGSQSAQFAQNIPH